MTNPEHKILQHADRAHKTVRFGIAFANIWWGFVVALPSAHQFSHSTLYKTLGAVASPQVWGAMFMAIGLALAIGVALHASRLRGVAALLSAMAWIAVFVNYVIALPSSTALPVTAFFVLVSMMLYVRETYIQRSYI